MMTPKPLWQFLPFAHSEKSYPVKAWIQGVPVNSSALRQLSNAASLPFIYKWVAAMPDVHFGKGSTVGSVIPTKKAIIPAAVGVDIGCGMMAVSLGLKASDLPDNLKAMRLAIEQAVPHGRTHQGKRGDRGAWQTFPTSVLDAWQTLSPAYVQLSKKYPRLGSGNDVNHLGTLGGGNHFIELCIDECSQVWVMLHSGSRGVGNRIGSFFIELAKKEMGAQLGSLPDQDLAYFKEGSQYFDDYFAAVEWAQAFAALNRKLMMQAVLTALKQSNTVPDFSLSGELAVNCHHNYVSRETHFGQSVYITRKGAVRARWGELGIIPGSMGAKSFIVRGLGNVESFESCSHGAGRIYSRNQAKKMFSLKDHAQATAGIECRKDKDVIDETPAAYKNIDAVMSAQKDLVEVVHTLTQLIVVKG